MTLSNREVQRVEAGERSVDRFVELRHNQRAAGERERAAQESWMEREREDAADRAELRKVLWMRHHARLEAVHSRLAQEHRQRLERLTSTTNGRNVSDG